MCIRDRLQGAFPKNFANPDIKWEETAMTNVGIDFMAFNNRLSLTAAVSYTHLDVYKRQPVVVPFIRMLAPIMGSPLTSVTVPVTVLACC